jgi:hypothetical protein
MVQPSTHLLLCSFTVLCCSACGEPAVGTTSTDAAPEAGAPPPRVVAIGDLHGDLDSALQALRLAGLVDEGGRWAGGETVLVQTGDLLDRGDDGVETVELMQRLQREAAQAGGRVEVLLGNHEVMNLMGDWRYVTAGDVEGYGGASARQAALSSTGEDGAWLRQRPVATRVGRTIFVHGGITPAMAELGLERVNGWVLAAMEGGADPAVLGSEGPLWYRGYLQGELTEACPALSRALLSLNAVRMVVGHTNQRSGRIAERCGGALIGIDTGISEHYGAHTAVLELRGGTDAWALYPEGPQDLPDP